MSESRVAREVVVHGRVQGVFFRDACRRRALGAGVAGWVRNEYDGTVRAFFEGPPSAVEGMVDWARTGPPHAAVDRVEVSVVQPIEATEFEVR